MGGSAVGRQQVRGGGPEADGAEVVQPSLSQRMDIVIADRYAPENRVTVYPGDCMELLRSMPDESVQLVVTSSPCI